MQRTNWATTYVLIFVGATLLGCSESEDKQPAVPSPSVQIVDLNDPGALESLARSNPQHFEILMRLLNGLNKRPELPDPEVAKWIETNFHVKEVQYTSIIMTSLPAQKDMAFTIGNTRYQARVHLFSDGAEALPISTRSRYSKPYTE